jgi:hypothetical protein
LRPDEGAVGDVFGHLSTASQVAWDRVVADIPDFNRELFAALAEQ